MRAVILFGGGDGGGFIITEHGIKPIPPFDPGILSTIKSAGKLVNAAATADVRMRAKLSKAAAGICNLAVEQVEEVVGPLSGEYSLAYQDEDGGFTCGSTGKPPIPFPWPPSPFPSVGDLVSTGVIQADIVEIVQKAKNSKTALTEVFEQPARAAEKLGVRLSQQSASILQSLAPSKAQAIKDPIDREIVTFFHKVAADGKHLETWIRQPYEVSRALKLKLSDEAIDRIVAGGTSLRGPGAVAADGAICAGIAWAGICIVVGIVCAIPSRPIDQIIRDRSRLAQAKI